MRLSLRGRLVAVSAALIALAGLASVFVLELSVRATYEQDVEEDLGRLAGAFARVLAQTDASDEELERIAAAFASDDAPRATVIAPDGRVVFDSAVPAAKLSSLDNHDARPEVRAARASGRGTARRQSATVGERLVYVAVPAGDGADVPVVRMATPLARVDAVIWRLRSLLLALGLLGFVVAVFMSGIATRQINRTLQTVVESARALSESTPGALRSEVTGISGTSFGRLAAEVNRLVKAIARDRDRVGAVLDGMQEAVLALDDEQRVVLANRAATELLEIKESPLGRPLEEVVDFPPLLELMREQTDEAQEIVLPGEPPRTVLTRQTRRGTGGSVIVLSDVTQLRRLEAVRRDFVANVSHELRTPVSVVLANAEALNSGALDDKERGPRFAAALQRNAQRLSNLITDLLDLARIESGTWEPRISDVGVADVVDHALGGLSDKVDERQQEIRLDVPADVRVRADTSAFEQVVVNLIENAIKYTPEGGHLEVTAHKAGDKVVLEVADDGPGIPDKHRTRVFQRFYRVDKGRSKEAGGTGLGLSIVRHLVMQMDGDVVALANEPRGARFRVTLPAA